MRFLWQTMYCSFEVNQALIDELWHAASKAEAGADEKGFLVLPQATEVGQPASPDAP